MIAIKFILESRLFISFAAILLSIESQILASEDISFHPYLILIFLATYLEYNLNIFMRSLKDKKILEKEFSTNILRNRSVYYLLIFTAVISFLITLFYMDLGILIFLLPLIMISLLYSIPKKYNKKYRLREFPFLKIFLILLVWTFSTAFIPLYLLELSFSLNSLIIHLQRILFLLPIALMFDLRDIKKDKGNLITFPQILGKKKTILISNYSLIIFIVLSLFQYFWISNLLILSVLIISAFFSLFIINSQQLQNSRYYYTAYLDGTMLLQGILILFANLF